MCQGLVSERLETVQRKNRKEKERLQHLRHHRPTARLLVVLMTLLIKKKDETVKQSYESFWNPGKAMQSREDGQAPQTTHHQRATILPDRQKDTDENL